MGSRYSTYRRGSDIGSLDVIDRILLGVCAAIWLVLIGVSVAAAVALVDLGRDFHKMVRNPHTTWVLYAIIIASALVIAGAIPVLLRARRMAQAESIARPVGSARDSRLAGSKSTAVRPLAGPGQANSGQVRVFSSSDWFGEAVDRVWLRGTVALTGTIGVALIAVAAATYLMAVRHDGASWVCYGLAGFVTAAMPAIGWLHARRLRQVLVMH